MRKQTIKFLPADNIASWRFNAQMFDYDQRITQDDAVPSLKEILARVSRGMTTGISSGIGEYDESDIDYSLMDKMELAEARLQLSEAEQRMSEPKQKPQEQSEKSQAKDPAENRPSDDERSGLERST